MEKVRVTEHRVENKRGAEQMEKNIESGSPNNEL